MATKKYVSDSKLQYFWNKIKTAFMASPTVSGTEGQVLTVGSQGAPVWEDTPKITFSDDSNGTVIMDANYGSMSTSSLSNLTDTNITSIQNKQIIQYNNTSNKWENTTPTWAELIETPSINIFDKTDITTGGVLMPNGEIMPVNQYYFYSYIPVTTAGSYTFIMPASFEITGSASLFNSAKEYLTQITGTTSYYNEEHSLVTITISQSDINNGCAYFGYSEMTSLLNSLMVVKGDTYPSSYINSDTINTINGLQIYRNQIIDDTMISNPLIGKILSVNGDSICAGELYSGGYARIIASENNMELQNIAVSGATIATGTTASHYISSSIINMRSDADYIILEGGVNDSSLEVPLGTITNGYSDTLDTTTFAGAFENMLKSALNRFPTAKIGYIFTHKASLGSFNSINGANSYYGIAKTACEKWGVPYLDLNILCPPLANVESLVSYSDGVHPTEQGYRLFYVPKITKWMQSL